MKIQMELAIALYVSRFKPERFFVLSVSDLPDSVVNAAAEAGRKSHCDEHPAPVRAGGQQMLLRIKAYFSRTAL